MKLLTSIAAVLGLLAFTAPAIAQAQGGSVDVFKDVCNSKNSKNSSQSGAVCVDKQTSGKNPLFGSDGVFTKIINIFTIVVGIAAVIMIIAGGLKLITSGSNPQEVSNGREMIIYALVGLIIAAMAQLIVRVFLSKIGGP